MHIWRDDTDLVFRFRSKSMDVSSVLSVESDLKLAEGDCIPPSDNPVKLSFAVTFVPSTGPEVFPSWEISGSASDSLALEEGNYVFDVLVTLTNGQKKRTPPYKIKKVGGVT